MPGQIPDTYICPQCGAEVPVGSPACPGCGPKFQEKETENPIYDGLDLPGSPEEESVFQAKVRRNKIFIQVVAGILLLIFIFGFVF